MKKIIVLLIGCITFSLLFNINGTALKNDDPEKLFEKAKEAANAFYFAGDCDFGSADFKKNVKLKGYDGQTFCATGLTKTELKEYMYSLFSPETADEIMSYETVINGVNTKRFVEYDGKMYYSTKEFLWANEDFSHYTETEVSDDKIVITDNCLDFHKGNTGAFYTRNKYVMERNAEGEWRFTKFANPYESMRTGGSAVSLTEENGKYKTVEEDLIGLFLTAEKSAGVFHFNNDFDFGSGALSADQVTVVKDAEGNKYVSTGLKREEIEKYMYSVFSKKLADKIMSYEFDGSMRFKEIDGIMCYSERATMWTGSESKRIYTVKEKSDDRIVLNVKIQTHEDVMEHSGFFSQFDYVLEKREDGDFVFTSFEYPYDLFMLTAESINPQTSDADIITVIAVAVLPVFAAMIYKKKRKAV